MQAQPYLQPMTYALCCRRRNKNRWKQTFAFTINKCERCVFSKARKNTIPFYSCKVSLEDLFGMYTTSQRKKCTQRKMFVWKSTDCEKWLWKVSQPKRPVWKNTDWETCKKRLNKGLHFLVAAKGIWREFEMILNVKTKARPAVRHMAKVKISFLGDISVFELEVWGYSTIFFGARNSVDFGRFLVV